MKYFSFCHSVSKCTCNFFEYLFFCHAFCYSKCWIKTRCQKRCKRFSQRSTKHFLEWSLSSTNRYSKVSATILYDESFLILRRTLKKTCVFFDSLMPYSTVCLCLTYVHCFMWSTKFDVRMYTVVKQTKTMFYVEKCQRRNWWPSEISCIYQFSPEECAVVYIRISICFVVFSSFSHFGLVSIQCLPSQLIDWSIQMRFCVKSN